MAALYEKMGKPDEAKRLQERAESIRSGKPSSEPKEISLEEQGGKSNY
jgi:hypothetical protein